MQVLILFSILVLLWTFREPKFIKGWADAIVSDTEKMTERLPRRLLKIATFYENNKYDRNISILNHDGTPMKNLFQAPMIPILAKGLGVTFNIVTPEDNTFGSLKPDGKSTGVGELMERGEADLSVTGFTMTEEILKAFPFTYPIYVSDHTFMTNKLEPHPKSFGMFEAFSLEVWLFIGLCLILVSLLLFFLLREKFPTMLFESVGCLLGQTYTFETRQRSTVLLLLHWFIAVTILNNSYKAVILSVITAPKMEGIRDISDLSKAVKQNSVKCFYFTEVKGNITWLQYENTKIINDCLIQSSSEGLYGIERFLNYPYKKVFLAERIELRSYGMHYHISDDSMEASLLGIPISRNFCCPRKLETLVHRIVAAGLYLKFLDDQSFIEKIRLLKEKEIAADNAGVSPLKLEDLTGAFIVLILGYLCSLFVFIAEIVYKKWN